MKRILYLLLTALALTACDKGGDSSSTITDYDPDQLNHILYADPTSGTGDFTFTAAENWTTQIADATRATDTDMWITALSQRQTFKV